MRIRDVTRNWISSGKMSTESYLDYVYTTPERNNAGRIYERLHYTVVVF